MNHKVTPVMEHYINIKYERPFFRKMMPMSEAGRKTLYDLVKQMENDGVIERGETMFVSTPILHRKNTGKLKCIVDARDINVHTNIERCKMPCFDEILSLLGKGR